VHDLATGMPHVTVVHGPQGNPIYQVGGRSFVFFRWLARASPTRAAAWLSTPRPMTGRSDLRL
jgi:hypothetical protein